MQATRQPRHDSSFRWPNSSIVVVEHASGREKQSAGSVHGRKRINWWRWNENIASLCAYIRNVVYVVKPLLPFGCTQLYKCSSGDFMHVIKRNSPYTIRTSSTSQSICLAAGPGPCYRLHNDICYKAARLYAQLQVGSGA